MRDWNASSCRNCDRAVIPGTISTEIPAARIQCFLTATTKDKRVAP